MDTNTAILIFGALMLIAVVVIGLKLWTRFSASVKTPFGEMEIDASNDPPAERPGIETERIISHNGDVTATDETGKGMALGTVEAEKDINLLERPTPKKA